MKGQQWCGEFLSVSDNDIKTELSYFMAATHWAGILENLSIKFPTSIGHIVHVYFAFLVFPLEKDSFQFF